MNQGFSKDVKYSAVFKYNQELRTLVETHWDKAGGISTPTQGIVAFALGKSHKTHEAVLLLCDRGFGQDAAILVRSMFELAVMALYIHKDKTGKLALRYMNHDWVLRKKMYGYIQSKDSIRKVMEADPRHTKEHLEEIKEGAENAQATFDYFHFSWSDKNLAEMAKAVRLKDVYETVYRLQSQLAHSATRSMNEYIFEVDGKFIHETGASDKWIDEALVTAFHFHYLIVGVWNKSFSLKMDNSIDDLAKRYTEEVGKLNQSELKRK